MGRQAVTGLYLIAMIGVVIGAISCFSGIISGPGWP